jgi:hypothetical protein
MSPWGIDEPLRQLRKGAVSQTSSTSCLSGKHGPYGWSSWAKTRQALSLVENQQTNRDLDSRFVGTNLASVAMLERLGTNICSINPQMESTATE